MRKRSLIPALVAIVLPICAGCSFTGGAIRSDTNEPPTSSVALDSPLATYAGPAVGMDAAVFGTLRLIDGCLGVGDPDAITEVLVFPADGASWSDGVLTWQKRTYRVGDKIQFGGGAAGDPSSIQHLPSGCGGLPAFLVGS